MHRRVSTHLISHSKRALVETQNVVPGASTWEQRNFAVAVLVSSDAPESKKSQRRLSKDERRYLVEPFVNKYRAMNSGNFPPPKTVQKELGGSYYVIRDIMSELQYKSRMPSTSTGNDTTWDAKLQKNASVNLERIVAIKNSELATKEEDQPSSALEEKTMDDIANMATLTSETRLSDKKHKLPTSAIDPKTLSDEITTKTSRAAVKVKKVYLAAQQADKPTSALDYKAFSEEIAIPSVTDDNSAETTDERYILKEEAKDFSSTARISEDSIREKTASGNDQHRQLSDLQNVTRDPEEHEKKPFRWNLKSLANGFMRIWRGSG